MRIQCSNIEHYFRAGVNTIRESSHQGPGAQTAGGDAEDQGIPKDQGRQCVLGTLRPLYTPAPIPCKVGGHLHERRRSDYRFQP